MVEFLTRGRDSRGMFLFYNSYTENLREINGGVLVGNGRSGVFVLKAEMALSTQNKYAWVFSRMRGGGGGWRLVALDGRRGCSRILLWFG